jgi:hypothetical protein
VLLNLLELCSIERFEGFPPIRCFLFCIEITKYGIVSIHEAFCFMSWLFVVGDTRYGHCVLYALHTNSYPLHHLFGLIIVTDIVV